MNASRYYFLNKEINLTENLLFELKSAENKTDINGSYPEGKRFIDLLQTSWLSNNTSDLALLVQKLRKLLKESPKVSRISFVQSESYSDLINEFSINTEEDEQQTITDFSLAFIEKYFREIGLNQQIKRIQKQIAFLKKCKSESIAIDTRPTIRHNIKNNLYRNSDESDHIVIYNLSLCLTNYGYSFNYYHHVSTIYKTADRKGPDCINFGRIKFRQKRSTAFGVCS